MTRKKLVKEAAYRGCWSTYVCLRVKDAVAFDYISFFVKVKQSNKTDHGNEYDY